MYLFVCVHVCSKMGDIVINMSAMNCLSFTPNFLTLPQPKSFIELCILFTYIGSNSIWQGFHPFKAYCINVPEIWLNDWIFTQSTTSPRFHAPPSISIKLNFTLSGISSSTEKLPTSSSSHWSPTDRRGATVLHLVWSPWKNLSDSVCCPSDVDKHNLMGDRPNPLRLHNIILNETTYTPGRNIVSHMLPEISNQHTFTKRAASPNLASRIKCEHKKKFFLLKLLQTVHEGKEEELGEVPNLCSILMENFLLFFFFTKTLIVATNASIGDHLPT